MPADFPAVLQEVLSSSSAPFIFIFIILLIILFVFIVSKRSDAGNLHAMYEKAMDLEVDCRYDEAWKLYTKYAKKAAPSAEAFYHMGMFCVSAKLFGWEYSKDDANPSFWFKKAAEMGHEPAKFQLLKIEFSEKFSTDLLKCAKIFENIKDFADNGLPEAARFVKDTEEELIQKVNEGTLDNDEVLSVLGNSENQFLLAKKRMEQNKNREAYDWMLLSAENGNPRAQFMVALFYRKGSEDGLIQINPNLAFEWYKKAEKGGYYKASVALGEMYYTGEGCEKNLLDAAESFAKAADNDNNPTAAHNAAICYYKYASECTDKKGITDSVNRKLDSDYIAYMNCSNKYTKLAEKLGYKKH